MSTLIVTYDLNKETKRPPLLADLKKLYPSWARLSESSYAISTSSTPKQVFDSLKKHLDDNDNLYVITLTHPYWGHGSQDVNDWLANNLPA